MNIINDIFNNITDEISFQAIAATLASRSENSFAEKHVFR